MFKRARSTSPYILGGVKSEGNAKYLCYLFNRAGVYRRDEECDPVVTMVAEEKYSTYIKDGLMYYNGSSTTPLDEYTALGDGEPFTYAQEGMFMRGTNFYQAKGSTVAFSDNVLRATDITLDYISAAHSPSSSEAMYIIQEGDIYRYTNSYSFSRQTTTGDFIRVEGYTSTNDSKNTRYAYAVNDKGELYYTSYTGNFTKIEGITVKDISRGQGYWYYNSSSISHSYCSCCLSEIGKVYVLEGTTPSQVTYQDSPTSGYIQIGGYTQVIPTSSEYPKTALLLHENGKLYRLYQKTVKPLNGIENVTHIQPCKPANSYVYVVSNGNVYRNTTYDSISTEYPWELIVGDIIGEPIYMGGTLGSSTSTDLAMIITRVN